MEMSWAITRSHNVGRIFGIRDFRSWREFMRSAPLLFSLFLLREKKPDLWIGENPGKSPARNPRTRVLQFIKFTKKKNNSSFQLLMSTFKLTSISQSLFLHQKCQQHQQNSIFYGNLWV